MARMNVWRLVFREIAYRKGHFALAVLAVLAAVGCLVAELTLLRRHDLETEDVLARKEAEVREQMRQAEAETGAQVRKLEDDYRKITKNLGFNVLILHKDQKLADLVADDVASTDMPEEYGSRLARAGVATINHLLPVLHAKITWPGTTRPVLLVGTKGELAIVRRDEKKPILDRVPPGTLVLGHALGQEFHLAKGDRVPLHGREFTVHKVHEPRGTKDDITAWVNLAEAQQMLGKEGRINAILALECNCADEERLPEIRKEIGQVLPDTQVVELATQALARAEARNRAAQEALDARQRTAAQARVAVEGVKDGRAQMRGEKEALAAWLVPLALFGGVVWLGVLTLLNVRERAGEVGVLRALGVRSPQVFALFLARAVLVGLAGALLGYAAGSALAAWGRPPEGVGAAAGLLSPVLLAAVVLAAPVVCALAAWPPALLAVRQDPAVILREE